MYLHSYYESSHRQFQQNLCGLHCTLTHAQKKNLQRNTGPLSARKQGKGGNPYEPLGAVLRTCLSLAGLGVLRARDALLKEKRAQDLSDVSTRFVELGSNSRFKPRSHSARPAMRDQRRATGDRRLATGDWQLVMVSPHPVAAQVP